MLDDSKKNGVITQLVHRILDAEEWIRNHKMTKHVNTSITGWENSSEIWSYSSLDSPTGILSVNADVTTILQKGMKLQYKQSQTLTAYFPFDANSTSTVGVFTSTDKNAPTYTAGKFSNALTLVAASSQSVEITDTALMKPTGAFMIRAWFKTSTAGANQFIFQSYSANANIAGFSIFVTSANVLNFTVGKNTGTTYLTDYNGLNGATVVTNGVWHFFELDVRNNYAQIYLNGKLEAAGYVFMPVYAATNYVRIGCQNNTGANVNFFNGQIDDLVLINGYALDEKTIYDKYIAGTAQGTSDIVVTKNAIITNVGAYSGGATLVTAYHGTDFDLANAAITDMRYSNVKSPFGFNANPDKWSVLVVDRTDPVKATPTISTWYGGADFTPTAPSIVVPIGCWNLSYKAHAQITDTAAAGFIPGMRVSLSTATASESDPDFSAQGASNQPAASQYVRTPIFMSKVISRSAKATYYIIGYTGTANIDTLAFIGSVFSMILRAECAYL